MSLKSGGAAAEARQVLRYGIVGLSSLAVHTVAAMELAIRLGLAAAVASAGGWLLGLVVSFLGHHYVTFRSDRAPAETAPRFLLLAASSLALNIGLSWSGAAMGLPAAAAAGLAAIAAAGTNYLLARFLFRSAAQPSILPSAEEGHPP